MRYLLRSASQMAGFEQWLSLELLANMGDSVIYGKLMKGERAGRRGDLMKAW